MNRASRLASPPRVRADLRSEVSPEEIELVRRKGLWKVVNEDGGTGGRARMKDCGGGGENRDRAGDRPRPRRKRGLVCLFRAIRPSEVCRRGDGPGRLRPRRRGRGPDRYTHSGTHCSRRKKANSICRSLGSHPRITPNPLQMIKSVSYDAGSNVGRRGRRGCRSSRRVPPCKWQSSDAAPDVEPEADSHGKSATRANAPAARAVPATPAAAAQLLSNGFLESHPSPGADPPPPAAGAQVQDESSVRIANCSHRQFG